MTNNNHDIEKMLSKTSFRTLSNEEGQRVWEGVLATRQKPNGLSLITKPMFTSLIIALLLSIGVGGTVVTADNAGPGDALFGVDQAVERLRLRLSGDEKKNELRIKFADERMKEIEKITSTDSQLDRPAADEVTESSVSEIEADVFTNETVIKIEYNDNKKFVFVSDAKTEAEVVDAILGAFPGLSKAFIEGKLNVEIEDRGSRAEDKKVKVSDDKLSSDDKIKVTTGVNAALALLNGVSASLEGDAALRLKLITDELNSYLSTLPGDSQAQVRVESKEDKTRVDLRTEDGRIRVEIKNGELRIKTDGDDDNSGWDKDKKDDTDDEDSDDDSNDEEDNTSRTSSANKNKLEIEADIFSNETVVKVELNDKKTTFTTTADTRAEIVAAVLASYPTLTRGEVESKLRIETEDRTSRIKDITGVSSGDDDEGDDDSDDANDDAEDQDDDSSDDSDDDSNDDGDSSGKGSDDDRDEEEDGN